MRPAPLSFLVSLVYLVGCAASVEQSASPQAGGAMAAPSNEQVLLRLDRPAVVGQVIRFQVHGSKRIEKRIIVAGGAPTTEAEQQQVEIRGLSRVVAVDANGRATREEVRIDECRFDADGAGGALLVPGTVLVIESLLRPGKGRYLVGETPLDPHTTDLLDLAFSRSHGDTNVDDVFGTRVPRRPGEQWSPDMNLFVREMAADMPGITVTQASGQVTFRGARLERGLDRGLERGLDRGLEVLDVGASLALRVGALPGLPPGTQVDSAGMVVDIASSLPRDPSLPSTRDCFSTRLDAALRVPTPAGPADLKMVVLVDKSVTQSPAGAQ